MIMSATIYRYNRKPNLQIDYQLLFNELREACFPTFKYKQGNCHNIIHYCSMILTSRGIAHKKIWFFAPSRLSLDSKVCISKPDPNHLAPSGSLRWGYHVALLFEDGKNCHVFDWMINENEPISINDWVMSMGLSNYKIDIVDPSNYLFFSMSEYAKKQERKGFEYFRYEGECKENHWIPKGLALNETAYEFFQNESGILEKDTLLSRDYRILVGSVINFECVIRDYDFNKNVTLKFQAKYFELIEKYRYVYLLKLNKWISHLDYLNL
jgi:hypothetical protein